MPLRVHQASITARIRGSRSPVGTAFEAFMQEKKGAVASPASRFRYGNSGGSQSWYREAPSGATGRQKNLEIALLDHVGTGTFEVDRWARVVANDRARTVLSAGRGIETAGVSCYP